MSTDPREFEHPIDGTTPNELPTVLGVGSLTPEAIEAAARALSGCRAEQWESAAPHVKDSNRWAAQVALTAALPFIAAQAKGEAFQAVRDAAEVEPDQVGDYGMVELPGYLTIDTSAFDALDKDDRERLHITADDYTQAIDDARAQAKAEAWDEGFSAGWAEAKDPGAFVNDIWDAQTPNPYSTATIEGKSE